MFQGALGGVDGVRGVPGLPRGSPLPIQVDLYCLICSAEAWTLDTTQFPVPIIAPSPRNERHRIASQARLSGVEKEEKGDDKLGETA